MSIKRLQQGCIFLLLSLAAMQASASAYTVFYSPVYWRASEQTDSIWATQVSSNAYTRERFGPANIGFDYSPGFKLGAQHTFDNNEWQSQLYWTSYGTKTNTNYRLNFQLLIPEFFSGFLSKNYFFGANSNWDLNMNTLDLQMSRAISLTDKLTLKAMLGIKGAVIDQTVNTVWDAILYQSTEHVTHDYFGVGPSFGVAAAYQFAEHWRVVGDAAASFLWGRWDVKDVYHRPAVPLVTTETTITTSLSDDQLGTWMLDDFIGLAWEHPGKVSTALQFGYEAQFWADQLRMTTFQQLPNRGDLTLQGATCGLYFTFS
jgi:hypothetical protein